MRESPGGPAPDLDFLSSHSLFGGLEPEAVLAVARHFEYHSFRPGEAVIREGEPSHRVWFILEGRVEVSRKGAPLAVYGPGDSFGEMEFLDIMPAAATCTALDEARLAALPGLALHDIYKDMPEAYAFLVMNLARDLSRRLRALQLTLDSLPQAPNSRS